MECCVIGPGAEGASLLAKSFVDTSAACFASKLAPAKNPRLKSAQPLARRRKRRLVLGKTKTNHALVIAIGIEG